MSKLNSTYIRLQPNQRLYQCPVPIIAITGSIATGKSSVSKLLTQLGFKVIDADLLVKKIYLKQDIISLVATHCSKAYMNDQINFKILRSQFFSNEVLKTTLETAIYKHLEDEFMACAQSAIKEGAHFLFYDVPLLFEKNIVEKVDLAVTVYASRSVQLDRLTARDNINMDLALKLVNSQMDIEEKKRRSDLIIDNQSSLKSLESEVFKFIKILQKK